MSELGDQLAANAVSLAETALALARLELAAADPHMSGLVPALETLAREWLASGCGYDPIAASAGQAAAETEDTCARQLLAALGIKE